MDLLSTAGPARRLRPRAVAAVLVVLVAASTACSGGEKVSQGAAQAARDGVVAELAALAFDERVSVQAELVAPEGVWVVSRPGAAAESAAQGCRLGPEGGKYPSEMICTTEYGEILLLDDGRDHILRAFPLPAVPAELLAITDEAVFCARAGTAALPDAMVCRIDRDTLEATVRAFPASPESIVDQPCFYPPPGWTVDGEFLEVDDIEVASGVLRVRDFSGGWRELDPVTLAVGAASEGAEASAEER
jgi:hypothetical protein